MCLGRREWRGPEPPAAQARLIVEGRDYIVITPVRNEAERIALTLRSMAAQTLRPAQWIVVDDGSTDDTLAICQEAARHLAWLTVVSRPDRGFRQPGTGVIEAFYDGYQHLATSTWDFLVKLDGDVSFDADYFERCLHQFLLEPKLGIGGGEVCVQRAGRFEAETKGDPPFHVRGATKIYRRACWDRISPLVKAPGWDTIDEVKANMLGWTTRTFPGLPLRQHKPTGSADGCWRDWYKNGRANYVTGYHPLFMACKCLRRTLRRPFGLAALGLWAGFVSGYLRRIPQVDDPQMIRYLRSQQLRQLLLRKGLWSPARRPS